MKRFKKLIAALCAGMMLFSLSACGATDTSGASDAQNAGTTSEEKITLQYMTLSEGKALEAERQIIENYMEKNPGVTVEITSIPVLDTFITTLKAKFSAGEEPDLYLFQAGTRVREFAQAGLLKDLTNEPYMEEYVYDIDKPFNSLNGKIYGVPLRYEYTGLFVNREALSKYEGVEIPTNFQEYMAACESLRQQGMEYPVLLAGKSINNVSQFDFQYLACVVSHQNPDYYQQMLDGELSFNDEIFYEMFEKYGEMKNYVSPDSLGVDDDEAMKRFIRGEGVFWVAHGSSIARMRELGGDEFDFVMVPTVLQDEDEDRMFNVGQAIALSVPESTEYPDQVRGLITEFLLPESSNIMATVGRVMPAAKGAEELPDPSLEPCREWFESDNKVGHADLVWVPGIKDVMKEITQKWYMGESIDSVLNEWESQHQRLLEANPDFIANYGKT